MFDERVTLPPPKGMSRARWVEGWFDYADLSRQQLSATIDMFGP